MAQDLGMDVRALLLEACERAGTSQAELARRSGTTPAVVSSWMAGRMSPRLASLTKVFAAVGLQVRASLEPLLADLDERVDAVLQRTVQLDLTSLASVAEKAAGEQRWSVELPDGTFERATGPLTWAFDGATALAMHGMAFPQDLTSICLLHDDAGRAWLSRGMVIGAGLGRISYWDATFEEARHHLQGIAVGAHGMLRIRLVERLPQPVLLQPAGTSTVVPVLTVDDVAAAHPALDEVLRRLRERGYFCLA